MRKKLKEIRKKGSFNRKRAIRSPYDRVLIVCEGDKTEPNYLKEIRRDLRLNTLNIIVCGEECGSSPKSVVGYALAKYKKEHKSFDKIFCVIDKDRHESYQASLDIIRRASLSKGHEIKAINSVPCFEVWLLLHYQFSTKPYDAAHGSICGKVIHDLKKHLPDYEKGMKSAYSKTKGDIDKAIAGAIRLKRHNKSAGTDNPSTRVHELIEYLHGLQKQ